MLTAKYHPLGKLFWDRYIHHIIKSDFERLQWINHGFELLPNHSLFVIANHCSWWDGFWVYELNRLLFNKKFHVMMLEEQLRQRPILRYAGAYSINRENARSMMESLQYTNRLLEQDDHMVLLFPQGRIESIYNPEPTFEKGAWRVMQQIKKPTQLLYCISSIDYMAERKPSLTLHLHGTQELPSSFDTLKEGFINAYQHSRKWQGEKFV